LFPNFRGDVGDPMVGELLANDEQTGKWHDTVILARLGP
jgi:hypothetical protein